MKTNLDFEIHNLEAAERAAKELLDHIEAIKKIQRDLAWDGVDADVTVRFTAEEEAGGEQMTEAEIKKMLEQQLQLLSKQSQKGVSADDLCALTREMAEIANLLLLYRTN